MSKPRKNLLIVSRDTLLLCEKRVESERIFRLLANINRKGWHLLLTAPEPDQWFPTRGSVDHALADQGRLQEKLQAAGGYLEGVYYVPRSLLTQNRNREGALKDILLRYASAVEDALLISGSVPFIKAAKRLGLETHVINENKDGSSNLEAVLEIIPID